MNLRDEISKVKRTKEEYQLLEKERKEKEVLRAYRRFEKRVIRELIAQIKEDACKGNIENGVLSGRCAFMERMIKDDSQEGYHSIGIDLRPDIQKRSLHKISWFRNVWVNEVTISPSQEILEAYNVLCKYALQENIKLSELYIIGTTDYDGVNIHNYEKKEMTITLDAKSNIRFFYAVDYSLQV